MSPTEKKKGFPAILEKVLALVDGVKGVIMILAALSVGGASGTIFAGGDTARVDSLEVRMDTLEARQGRQEQRQMDFFSAQVEADSALRAVLENRATDRWKADREREAVEKLINQGGTP